MYAVYMYSYSHICTYIFIHIHTHTHTQVRLQGRIDVLTEKLDQDSEFRKLREEIDALLVGIYLYIYIHISLQIYI
jgi:hypothetical protein